MLLRVLLQHRLLLWLFRLPLLRSLLLVSTGKRSKPPLCHTRNLHRIVRVILVRVSVLRFVLRPCTWPISRARKIIGHCRLCVNLLDQRCRHWTPADHLQRWGRGCPCCSP